MPDKIFSYKDLRVYQNAMEAAMKIYELTKKFPAEEKYSLTDGWQLSHIKIVIMTIDGSRNNLIRRIAGTLN